MMILPFFGSQVDRFDFASLLQPEKETEMGDFVLMALPQAASRNGRNKWEILAVGDKSVIQPAMVYHKGRLLSLVHNRTDRNGQYEIINGLGYGVKDPERIQEFLDKGD